MANGGSWQYDKELVTIQKRSEKPLLANMFENCQDFLVINEKVCFDEWNRLLIVIDSDKRLLVENRTDELSMWKIRDVARSNQIFCMISNKLQVDLNAIASVWEGHYGIRMWRDKSNDNNIFDTILSQRNQVSGHTLISVRRANNQLSRAQSITLFQTELFKNVTGLYPLNSQIFSTIVKFTSVMHWLAPIKLQQNALKV